MSGEFTASGSNDRTARIWIMATGEMLVKLNLSEISTDQASNQNVPSSLPVTAVVFSPDNNLLVEAEKLQPITGVLEFAGGIISLPVSCFFRTTKPGFQTTVMQIARLRLNLIT